MADTEKQIQIAARNLFENHSFGKVTIDEIAAAAGVSRATFYRHFKDKYDLMLQTIYLDEKGQDVPYDFKCSLSEHVEYCYYVSRRMKKNADYIKKAFKIDGPNSFYDACCDWMTWIFSERIIRNSPNKVPTAEEKYMISIYCHGAVEASKQWINEGCVMSPEEFSSILINCMPQHFLQFFPKAVK